MPICFHNCRPVHSIISDIFSVENWKGSHPWQMQNKAKSSWKAEARDRCFLMARTASFSCSSSQWVLLAGEASPCCLSLPLRHASEQWETEGRHEAGPRQGPLAILWPGGKVSIKRKSSEDVTSPGLQFPRLLETDFQSWSWVTPFWSCFWLLFKFFWQRIFRSRQAWIPTFMIAFCTGILMTRYSLQNI